ncbi:conserved hypothetical protein [Ricinus communis]|uniref:Uncharacterized protein n=1 Tax=Ricinus communis TaxID=3988 RepID=B9RFR1_RICCO|nr:conserved hypothetical protein [Ricinus communis]
MFRTKKKRKEFPAKAEKLRQPQEKKRSESSSSLLPTSCRVHFNMGMQGRNGLFGSGWT